jgi:hypothetical protein
MTDQNADEAKTANIAKMGEPLGELYSALWQALTIVYVYWKDYMELFGTNRERIALLNRAAPAFFRMIQDELWELSLLHIARLTDPANSLGRQDRPNLTIQGLPALISDLKLNSHVHNLIQEALKKTAFCRDWRNRHIAHRDLRLTLEQPTEPLAEASIAQVNTSLKALAAVLNAVAAHYLKSETRFDMTARHNGALTLLYLMDDGLRAKEERAKRIESGAPLDRDLARKAL